jgi:hypothetical protein
MNTQLSNLEVQFRLRGPASRPAQSLMAASAIGSTTIDAGTVPRIALVLALAIEFDEMVRNGSAKNRSDLARLCCVSRERISQVMKLQWLAPSIQEEILQLPKACSFSALFAIVTFITPTPNTSKRNLQATYRILLGANGARTR